jgi:prefoldin subunit 5
VTADAQPAAPAASAHGNLDEKLQALRDKAGRIVEDLAALYRRMGELQQQIEDHQRR